MIRKIYLASSWRNKQQPEVLAMLRDNGHEVYDFRNPIPDKIGFAWNQCKTELKENLTMQTYYMFEAPEERKNPKP